MPPQNLKKVNYDSLNPRQQENYNFLQISAVLPDYGFTTLRLSDDWRGEKGRFCFDAVNCLIWSLLQAG